MRIPLFKSLIKAAYTALLSLSLASTAPAFPANDTPPAITLDLPNDQTLTAPQPLTGSIDDDQLTAWSIRLYPQGQSQPTAMK